MKLLVLGGTEFLGRHFVEGALAAGHEITLFNRGQSHPDLFPELEKLRGDRYGSLDALRGRAWDAVIDTTGYSTRSHPGLECPSGCPAATRDSFGAELTGRWLPVCIFVR